MFKKFFSWLIFRRKSPAGLPLSRSEAPQPSAPSSLDHLSRMERVVLTAQVARTLFDEYQAHRSTSRGDEEIGWTLLGKRQGNEALALATLPAGSRRDAGTAHVEFNSEAQALASRILRQHDKHLTTLGMVHTHPGSLRHPSGGDFEGDSAWVTRLRGGEGVFGIGTADAKNETQAAHQQIEGPLLFSWFALGEGEKSYRRLPVSMTPGTDLARPLHALWDTLECFAAPLERLARQLSGLTMKAAGVTLVVTVQLAKPEDRLRVVLQKEAAWYYVEQGTRISAVDPKERSLERAVFLILAELALRANG